MITIRVDSNIAADAIDTLVDAIISAISDCIFNHSIIFPTTAVISITTPSVTLIKEAVMNYR